ncbi:MAG: class I SAM-dependent methyltransferase [Thermoguttaceae bacterium]
MRGTHAVAGEVEGKGTDGDSHIWPRAEAHATETRGNGPSTDNSKCAILVPVGSHVEPACEEALRELERRGYAVRRVRGFSAIDQGRNQMATDALAAGFEETMWIDSDIGFDPAAVDRLRSHPLPIVCAIYPKKGKRELACHVMPGTRQIVFGQGGGLIEILYAGTGFLLVRREVYAEMRRQLQLPSCNDAWGTPMLPFFQPMVKPHGEGYWYLAEDFAFSQRARQCGYKIMADTTIRLSHFGGFAYSWEQAGMDPPKYATFNFHLSGMDADAAPPKPEDPTPKAEDPSKTAVEATTNHTKKAKTESGVDVHQTVEAAAAPVGRSDGLEKLAAQHPWPSLPPQTPANKEHGWLLDSTREMLAASLSAQPRVIVELGSWLGLSTRFIADCAPCGTVIAIDHWKGGPDHQDREEYRAMLPHLYETFLASCWEYRGRIIPVRASTIEGLREVAGYGVRPDLIYLDADHTYDAVKRDLEEALALFPSARIVGDDWTWQSVREAVTAVCAERGLTVIGSGNAWQIER